MANNWVMKKEVSFEHFKQRLAQEGIRLVARQNSEGNIYGLTNIDFRNKRVFNGSDKKQFSTTSQVIMALVGQFVIGCIATTIISFFMKKKIMKKIAIVIAILFIHHCKYLRK